MGSPILLPTPWPESPSLSHPESEEALAQLSGTVLGMPGRVLPSEHPPRACSRAGLSAFTCRAAAWRGSQPSRAARGARARRRGRRRGPRRRVSASLCRPPSRLPEWAGGGNRGGGRGAAGRGLHPPLSTATAKARAPRPARAPSRAWTSASLPKTHSETPPQPHTSQEGASRPPVTLTHPVPARLLPSRATV